MAGKFNSRVVEGIFLGYSLNSKAYRVYNKRTLKVEESTNIRFDEPADSFDEEDEVELNAGENAIKKTTEDTIAPDIVASIDPIIDSISEDIIKLKFKHSSSHPKKLIVGECSDPKKTRAMLKKMENHFALIFQIVPKCVEEALN